MAFVYQHHAAAALVFKRYFADDKFVGLVLRGNLRVFQTDKADLRIGEHHADGTAAQTAADIRIAARVVAGNLALVGGFVQQGQLVGRVARDEDMRNTGLHGQRIGNGYAARVFFDINVFQTDIVNVRTATYGCQHIFGNKYAFFAVLLPMNFYIAVRIEFDLGFSIQMQFQFFAEHGFRFV